MRAQTCSLLIIHSNSDCGTHSSAVHRAVRRARNNERERKHTREREKDEYKDIGIPGQKHGHIWARADHMIPRLSCLVGR